MSFDKPKIAKFDASRYYFGIAAARYNEELTDALLNDVLATISCSGVPTSHIKIVRVPGAGELPHVCALLANSGECDAVVALGVVVAGDTSHHEIIGNSTATALQNVAIATSIPVVNGIIVANNKEQAEARTIGSIRRGVEFGEVALEMAHTTDLLMQEYASDEE